MRGNGILLLDFGNVSLMATKSFVDTNHLSDYLSSPFPNNNNKFSKENEYLAADL